MSRHHRVGESADLISPAPKTDFFNTIDPKQTFAAAQKSQILLCGGFANSALSATLNPTLRAPRLNT